LQLPEGKAMHRGKRNCAERRSVAVLTLAAMAGLAPPAGAQIVAPASPAVTLQPHRAVYDVSLDDTGPAMSISSISGRVVYELMGSACEGYAQNMRFVTETATTDGQTSMTDLRTSSWEDSAARRMRFSSSTYGNDQLAEQTQGTASKIDGGGKPGSKHPPAAKLPEAASGGSNALAVELTKPERQSARIDAPVYFPIDHSIALIRQAKSAGRVFSGNLYDGSEGGQKYYFTAASIGKVSANEHLSAVPKFTGDLKKLQGLRSWPVSIAYFKPEERHFDQLPLYEMSFRFHENGITSNLVIDHGDYRLKGELKELTLIEQSPCP
jgi:hypothetical protein